MYISELVCFCFLARKSLDLYMTSEAGPLLGEYMFLTCVNSN